MKFEENFIINGKELTRNYIESLNDIDRNSLVKPILNELRKVGFVFPSDTKKVIKEYKRLCELKVDTNSNEVFNNSSIGTYICRYFCKSFFKGTEKRGDKVSPNMIDLFNDDVALEKVIRNRLGLDWYKLHGEDDIEAFCISPRQIVQGFRSSRAVISLSMFKPEIAKFIYEKYSNEGDIVYDYSMGFGGRLLGAMSSNRRYVGVDPLTANELGDMKKFFSWNNCLLVNGCSENFVLGKNSIDLAFSSPPYFDQEIFSIRETQAYNKGEDFFYNIYWSKTLENIYNMLKPNKIFALNVKNCPRMVEMVTQFELIDKIGMRTVRSHLNKKAGVEKMEYIYVFRKPYK